jgi:A/G-specific adenine glycosylase
LLVPPEGEPAEVAARFGLALGETTKLPPFRHAFTHFRLTLEPVLCRIDAAFQVNEPGLEWVELGRAADAGVPAPIKKLIRQVASARG